MGPRYEHADQTADDQSEKGRHEREGRERKMAKKGKQQVWRRRRRKTKKRGRVKETQ